MIQILRGSFSAAHFYHQTQWSVERNRTEFGKCFNQFGHGHDYRLELTIRFDHEDKLLVVQKLFAEILNQLDHHHLNFTFVEFHQTIPTTENLALFIQNQLLMGLQNRKDSVGLQILKIRLFETPDLWVEITNPPQELAQETFSKI